MLDKVDVNIWDDYYEDDYIPEGENQETYIYVEDTSISHEHRKKYLEYLMFYLKMHMGINDLKMWMNWYDSKKKYPNLVGEEYETMHFQRWEIRIEGLTHRKREEIVKQLQKEPLTLNGLLFNVYSES